jgi:hypothetical protein
LNDLLLLSGLFRRTKRRRTRRRKIKKGDKIKKRRRKIGVMESIGIRKTKRKSIERKRRRIEIRIKTKVVPQMKRDFWGKLRLTMEETEPQMKGKFLGNLMVERCALRRGRKGIWIKIVSLVTKKLLDSFQVITVRSSFKTAICLTNLRSPNLYNSWARGPERKTESSSLRSSLIQMQKEMREWLDWWQRPLAIGLTEKRRTREMMIERWMGKESGMRQDLLQVLRVFLEHSRLKLMECQDHWRKTMRRRWKGKIRPNKRKARINVKIKRKKAKRRIKSGIKRRKKRRKLRRKASIR